MNSQPYLRQGANPMKIRTATLNEYLLFDLGYWTVMATFVTLCVVATRIILT